MINAGMILKTIEWIPLIITIVTKVLPSAYEIYTSCDDETKQEAVPKIRQAVNKINPLYQIGDTEASICYDIVHWIVKKPERHEQNKEIQDVDKE